jgi:hypothetical protein
MEAALQFLLPMTLVAVFVVLMTGIVGFIIGGEFNRKYANKLMRLRVAAQTVAIVLLVLLLLVKGFFN